MKGRKNVGIISLIFPAVFCTMLWGTAFPGIKVGYDLFSIAAGDSGSKMLFAGARFFIAGIIVIAVSVLKRKNGEKIVPEKKDIFPLTLLGFFQTFLQYTLLYTGISSVSGTKSSVYTSVAAFATVLVSPLFFKKDRLTVMKVFGCIAGVAGIAFMSLGDGSISEFILLGDGLVLMSNLSGAAGNIISKKISSPDRTPSFISGWQLLFGGAGLIVCGVLSGGRLYTDNVSGWLLLLYLAAMAGAAFMIWTGLLKKNPVSRVAVFNMLIPIFGTLWSGLFLNETIFTAANVTAIILVCFGILLVNVSASDTKKAKHLTNKYN